MPQDCHFTTTELRTLRRWAQGLTDREQALQDGVRFAAIPGRWRRMRDRLGLPSRIEILVMALAAGQVQVEELQSPPHDPRSSS